MDVEVEDFFDKNNTDELDDYLYELTAWDVIQASVGITFTLVGGIADVVLIYMIARNVRMRTKTNLLLMNFAINDLFFLLTNMHFLSSVMELLGTSNHISILNKCVMQIMDVGFQLNETVFLSIIISNTLVKSKWINFKWLIIVVYSFIGVNFLIHQILCYFYWWPIMYFICFILFMLNLAVIILKEFNNCYKKCYKKDPLSERTRFRFNIGRIYIATWCFTFFLYLIADAGTRYLFYTLAQQGFLSSLYILIYVVCADKHFKICLLNLLQCKGAGAYDVDATITFAEESSEESSDNNRININFNVNQNQTQISQDISTIRVA